MLFTNIRNLFAQIANKNVNNTAAETSLIGTGVGSLTIPANQLVIGNTIRVQLRGFFSTTSSPDIDFNFKLGSTSIVTLGASAAGTGVANQAFLVWYTFTIRAVGASGSIIGQSQTTLYTNHTASKSYDIEMLSPVTIDTTGDLAIDITCTWSAASAGNTITSTNCIVELLN